MSTFPGYILRRSEISERSLELNVMGEALDKVRKLYSKAYIVGYTTRQEAYHGLDISIEVPSNGSSTVLAAFQFKAPKKRNGEYVFEIGRRCWVCSNPSIKRRQGESITEMLKRLNIPPNCINQHVILYIIALNMKNEGGVDVYYALPLISTYDELAQYVPHTLQRTVLIPVLKLPTTQPCRTHKIRIRVPGGNVKNVVVWVNSEPVRLPRESYVFFDELLEKLSERKELPKIKPKIHISIDKLKAILRDVFAKIENGEKLAEALVQVSYTYRGSALAVGKDQWKNIFY